MTNTQTAAPIDCCTPCNSGEHADDGTGQDCPCCGTYVSEQVKCPNCTDGIRKTSPVVIKCGTCWGEGTLTQDALDRALMLAGRR